MLIGRHTKLGNVNLGIRLSDGGYFAPLSGDEGSSQICLLRSIDSFRPVLKGGPTRASTVKATPYIVLLPLHHHTSMISLEATYVPSRIWNGITRGLTSSLGALRSRGTVNSGTTYRYDELPEHAFRYLVLRPGVEDEPLVCTLHTSNVNDVKYEAISYVWGTEVQDHDIVCDGTLVKITSNLKRSAPAGAADGHREDSLG